MPTITRYHIASKGKMEANLVTIELCPRVIMVECWRNKAQDNKMASQNLHANLVEKHNYPQETQSTER